MNVLINGNTAVFLDPAGNDHIVVRFVTDAFGFQREITLQPGHPNFTQAVARATHAAAFLG